MHVCNFACLYVILQILLICLFFIAWSKKKPHNIKTGFPAAWKTQNCHGEINSLRTCESQRSQKKVRKKSEENFNLAWKNRKNQDNIRPKFVENLVKTYKFKQGYFPKNSSSFIQIFNSELLPNYILVMVTLNRK